MKRFIRSVLVRFLPSLVQFRREKIKQRNRKIAQADPMALVKLAHKKYYKKEMDLEHPVTLHEKLFWMECYSDTAEWSRLTDKVAVRDYVVVP